MSKKLVSGATGAFVVLVDDIELDDITSVTLPDNEVPTTEVSGAGIMGKVNVPQSGQVNAMTVSISARRFGKKKGTLIRSGEHKIEVRIATDVRASNGEMYVEGTKIFASGYFTKLGGGKAEAGVTRDESVDYSVPKYREVVDGEETIKIDQWNGINSAGGVDRNSAVRSILY